MNKSVRIIIPAAIVLIGIILITIQLTKKVEKMDTKPQEINYWQYKLNDNNRSPLFSCKGGKYYTFKSQHGFSKMIVMDGGKRNEYNLRLFKGRSPIQFIMYIPVDSNIEFICQLSGVYYKSGMIEMWEGKASDAPELLFLKPGEYSKTLFAVKKGVYFEIPSQEEAYYVGRFNGNKLVEEHLIRRAKRIDTPEVFTAVSHGWKTLFFYWNGGDIKIKTAEVPVLIAKPDGPIVDDTTIEIDNSNHSNFKPFKRNLEPYFLNTGEVIKTPIWLEKGDHINIDGSKTLEGAQVSCGNAWQRLGRPYYGYRFDSKEDGYLKIRAGEKCRIGKITIKHNKKWEFNLSPGETKRLPVYPQDIIRTHANNRYYVNGVLQDRGHNIHHIGTQGNFEIRASLTREKIGVDVISRRGY
jgi:hypothetical protein